MNLNHRIDHGRHHLARRRHRLGAVPANPAAGNRARPPPLVPTAGPLSRNPALPYAGIAARPRIAAAFTPGPYLPAAVPRPTPP